jgi:predicted peptidase
MRFLSAILLTVAALSCGGSEPSGLLSNGGTGGNPDPGPVIAPVKGFAKRSVSQSGIAFPYQVFAPQNYVATQKWPIVVALAGTEERGNDNEKQVAVGMGSLVRAQPTFPAVVVFPQIPSDATAAAIFDQAVFQQIADIVRDYNGDPDRVYLTGLSFGGTAGFSLLYNTPGKFAAFLAVSPGMCPRCISNASTLDQANSLVADKLKTLPVWLHWGDQDLSAAVASNRQLVADFKADGATALKYNEYAGQGHVIWDMVYATPAVWTWLFAQRR